MCAGQYFIKPDISSCSSDYGGRVATRSPESGIDCHCPCVFIPLLMFMLTLTYLASYRFAISVRWPSRNHCRNEPIRAERSRHRFNVLPMPQCRHPPSRSRGRWRQLQCSLIGAWPQVIWTMTCRNERVLIIDGVNLLFF